MRKPRAYQSECCNAIREAFRSGKKAVVVEAFTGFGKGFVIADIARMTVEKGGKVLVLVNRDNLVEQLTESLREQGLYPVVERGQDKASVMADVVMGSIQTLQGERLKRWPQDKFTLVICDECFVEGTIIETEFGPMPIEEVPPGVRVVSFNHETGKTELSRVLSVSVKNVTEDCIAEINMDDGRKLVSTCDHPVWNGSEYVPVKDLRSHGSVYSMAQYAKSKTENRDSDKLPMVRKESYLHQCAHKDDVFPISGRIQEQGVCVLLGAVQGYGVLERESSEQDVEQSDAQAGSKSEAGGYASSDGMEASYSRRKRKAPAASSTDSGFYSWMENGVSSEDVQAARQRMADSLHAGHSKRGSKNRGGDRRGVSLLAREAIARSKEGQPIEGIRMAGDPVQKFAGDLGPPSVRNGCTVINFNVEGNHNYFANGILVHNCHGAGSRTFKNTLEYFKAAYHLGMSATVARHDKKGLWEGYEDIIFRMPLLAHPDRPEWGGVEQGWLVPFEFVEMPIPIIISDDLAKKKMFTEEDETGVFEKGEYLPRLFAEASARVSEKKALFFWPNCKSSEEAAKHFKENGIESRHIDGYQHKNVIAETLDWFKSPGPKSLMNADLLSVGYDNPSIDCVGIMRLSRSIPMLKQRLGRGTRPLCPVDLYESALDRRCAIHFSSKPKCTVLDLMVQLGEVKNTFADPSVLITDDEEEREFLRNERAKGGAFTAEELGDKLRMKREVDADKALAKLAEDAANAAIRFEQKKFGPFLGHILKVERKENWKPASSKQISYLRRLGFNGIAPSGWHAMKIIDAYLQHREKGYALK